MSPRTLLRGLVPFGRAISARRFSRHNARRPRRQWLGAESLEPRAMLSTVPFRADSALQTATVFTAQGRYGNNAINGDWELGITSNTNKPPQQQTGHVWNGSLDSATGVTTVREQFTFDVLNTTAASFGVGGSNKISFDYAGQLTGNQPNAIKIWAKASTANSSLTLANLKLTTPGMSVPKEFPAASIAVSQSSGPDFQQRLIAGVDFSSGSGQSVTLTGDLGMSFAQTSPRGSSLQFHVMAVYLPVPIVTVDVAPGQVTEDGPQNLTYTFTATGPLTRDLTVKYEVGGTATEGGDFTGAPSGTGVRSITIPATASPTSSATLTITPTPDTVIEDDETVAISLQNGSGYTFDPNRSFATGTIENDDYLLDLVLDGLPEETAPEPNELSPGAILPIGGCRTRLDLIVESPGYAGTLTLFVTTGADGADAVTLWDSKKDGKQVLPTTWQVGQHPRTLWVETTGVEADVQFIAMFQNKGTTKQDAAHAVAVASRPDITFDPQDITARVSSWMNGRKNRLEDGGVDTLNLGVGIHVDHAIGTFRSIKVVTKAIDDQAIGRQDTESFYFKGNHTTSGWNILRGVDHNPGGPVLWLRDHHPDVGVRTPKDFSTLPTDEQKKWTEEYERWSDPRVTAQRMTGTLDVTYIYAGKLAPGTAWLPARQKFNLYAGDPTPPGSPYPYDRPLNVDASRWMQGFPHRAEKPDDWDFVSTLTLHLEFLIDLENDQASVTGTWVIDDIDGVRAGLVNVNATIH
jgi:hypothetical protein